MAQIHPLPQQPPPDTQATSNELVKLIRKLRWIGMEEEARQVQARLERHSVRSADCVLATPRDTD